MRKALVDSNACVSYAPDRGTVTVDCQGCVGVISPVYCGLPQHHLVAASGERGDPVFECAYRRLAELQSLNVLGHRDDDHLDLPVGPPVDAKVKDKTDGIGSSTNTGSTSYCSRQCVGDSMSGVIGGHE